MTQHNCIGRTIDYLVKLQFDVPKSRSFARNRLAILHIYVLDQHNIIFVVIAHNSKTPNKNNFIINVRYIEKIVQRAVTLITSFTNFNSNMQQRSFHSYYTL